ncbi:MAG: archaetidylserine decarboxylase [Methylococcaceae bacterium]|nr:archaetidylserine decarboxylase [Methylococcaceae bacterium]MCI0663145.1 archaetidylserine decarboxylase [Acidobacteriota bacterium]MCI0666922.1 archaetidylserine decarboxylase [Methylococcaceae bacterium]
MAALIRTLGQREQLNFLLTNRIPRRLLTQWMGWYSRIENPFLTRFSLFVWRLFADDLNLDESKQQCFKSLHDCFIRELKDGVRPIDRHEHIVVSPCDGIIGAFGSVQGTTLYQAKGFPYELSDLIPEKRLHEKYRDGLYVTLRLRSTMYHRFHAPVDCEVKEVNYISGDTWNVNPVALKRIEKLYCKNERAVIELETGKEGRAIALAPVAAILVASMKFHCLDFPLDLKYQGPNRLACRARYNKGDEIGYFQHGSTLIVFATPNYTFCEKIELNGRIRMGQPLLIEQ